MASNPANEKDERGERETTGVQVRLMDLHGSGCIRLAKLIMAQEKVEKNQRLNESWNAIRIKEILRGRDLGF